MNRSAAGYHKMQWQYNKKTALPSRQLGVSPCPPLMVSGTGTYVSLDNKDAVPLLLQLGQELPQVGVGHCK